MTNKKQTLKVCFLLLMAGTTSGFAYVLSLRKQELQSNSFPRSEIRIARKLSKLEPKVLLRNFPSVEQIQDKVVGDRMGNILKSWKI